MSLGRRQHRPDLPASSAARRSTGRSPRKRRGSPGTPSSSGVDILTAIRNGAPRTPSKRFQDFLQGVVTTATSGGQLKPVLPAQGASSSSGSTSSSMLQRVETMGLLAETFVTVVVAFPLFLIIIIAIFAVIGGGGAFMIDILWGSCWAMIPLAQFGFIFFMCRSRRRGLDGDRERPSASRPAACGASVAPTEATPGAVRSPARLCPASAAGRRRGRLLGRRDA